MNRQEFFSLASALPARRPIRPELSCVFDPELRPKETHAKISWTRASEAGGHRFLFAEAGYQFNK
jgi:hypothetical protein